jgi:hypothetical protein
MGYGLLWIVTLAAELMLFAILVACIARLKRRWLRASLWVLLVAVCAVSYGGLVLIGLGAKILVERLMERAHRAISCVPTSPASNADPAVPR